MTPLSETALRPSLRAEAAPRRRDPRALASDLLPLADVLCLLLAAALASALTAAWRTPGVAHELAGAGWFGAVVAPFMLYDPRFGRAASIGRTSALLGTHALRFGAFAAAIVLLGTLGNLTPAVASVDLVVWLALGLLSTALLRAIAAAGLRRLQRQPAQGRTGPSEWIVLAERPIGRWDAVMKSAEDLLLGGLLTLLLLPVLAAIALAIKIDSRGPVLFRQRRHALNNHEFDIFKFRSMRWDGPAEGDALTQTCRGDMRITRVGRVLRATSLDELPQLFNVLQGSMSLVGPRPHATQMRTEARLGCEITAQYAHRHRVKPGITGWAQVNGARGATDTTAQLQRRVDLDLHYIEHWSLWLDLKILAMTWRAVIRRTNAF